MDRIITALPINPDMDSETFNLPLPGQCPVCDIAYLDVPIDTYYVEGKERNYGRPIAYVYALYFCPHCEQFFLVRYLSALTANSYKDALEGHIDITYPFVMRKTGFSARIEALSPQFVKIYQQSERAENYGLTEICGMGYRKALEFLIKDYSIFFHPSKESDIVKTQLSRCIGEYIDNKRIKSLATASAWIGNDETHYERKHEDYNLEHLKLFVSAVVSHIDSELAYRLSINLLANPSK